ncbi:MAG: hypothetical protein PHE89_05950 [Alphaproteobacteria bacterium]|nr:hypothetical protein [Alphaproteobacteria bacterium]
MKKSYFIFSGAVLLFCSSFALTYNAFAGVYFITKPTTTSVGFSNKPCSAMGYDIKATDCTDGEDPFEKCPNGDYFRICACDIKKYPYNTTNCLNPLELGGASCKNKQFEKCQCNETKYPYTTANCYGDNFPSGNYCKDLNNITHYEKCSCPSTFPYTASNCTSPKILGGNTCKDSSNVTHYKACSCPSTYVTCNCGGEGTACNDGTEKYASCKSCVTCADGGYFSYHTYAVCTTDVCKCMPTDSITYKGLTCYKNCIEPKYEISTDCKTFSHPITGNNVKVCRIKALRAFTDLQGTKIKVGALGGYVEKRSDNLNLYDNSWIKDSAMVYDKANISGSSLIMNNAQIFENGIVYGGNLVYGNARVYGTAKISGSRTTVQVYGNAKVYGASSIDGGQIYDSAEIYGNARIQTNMQYDTPIHIFGNAKVYKSGNINGYSNISGNATICTSVVNLSVTTGNYGCD